MLTMPTIILTFGLYLLAVRWACGAVGRGAWRTAAIIVAGEPLAMLWALAAAFFVAYFAQSLPGYDANTYVLFGVKNGGSCMILHPLVVWAYRRERRTAPAARPIG